MIAATGELRPHCEGPQATFRLRGELIRQVSGRGGDGRRVQGARPSLPLTRPREVEEPLWPCLLLILAAR